MRKVPSKRSSSAWCCSLALALAVLALIPRYSNAFSLQPPLPSGTRASAGKSSRLRAATSFPPDFLDAVTPTTTTTAPSTSSKVQLKTYTHDDWTLKYRYKPASPGFENASPLLLVHPVGIGMSSWFWDEFLDTYEGGSAVYAPDLIGCGIDHGSDAWIPEERGLFFPLSWVQGCESLLQIILSEEQQPANNLLPFSSLFNNKNNSNNPKITVVTQGGLAPVGVMLASRNPKTVGKLVMTSPPTWQDMTTAVPEEELESNYKFLKSKQGGWAFGALEQEWAIRFFSNLFLFEDKCGSKWLDLCLKECQYSLARPPIQAFNAGLMQHRSYEQELTTLPQETIIVQGQDDASRNPQRQDYATQMQNCQLVTFSKGKNVLPWECAKEFATLFLASTTTNSK